MKSVKNIIQLVDTKNASAENFIYAKDFIKVLVSA